MSTSGEITLTMHLFHSFGFSWPHWKHLGLSRGFFLQEYADTDQLSFRQLSRR